MSRIRLSGHMPLNANSLIKIGMPENTNRLAHYRLIRKMSRLSSSWRGDSEWPYRASCTIPAVSRAWQTGLSATCLNMAHTWNHSSDPGWVEANRFKEGAMVMSGTCLCARLTRVLVSVRISTTYRGRSSKFVIVSSIRKWNCRSCNAGYLMSMSIINRSHCEIPVRMLDTSRSGFSRSGILMSVPDIKRGNAPKLMDMHRYTVPTRNKKLMWMKRIRIIRMVHETRDRDFHLLGSFWIQKNFETVINIHRNAI
jgi:hypothetical protein